MRYNWRREIKWIRPVLTDNFVSTSKLSTRSFGRPLPDAVNGVTRARARARTHARDNARYTCLHCTRMRRKASSVPIRGESCGLARHFVRHVHEWHVKRLAPRADMRNRNVRLSMHDAHVSTGRKRTSFGETVSNWRENFENRNVEEKRIIFELFYRVNIDRNGSKYIILNLMYNYIK